MKPTAEMIEAAARAAYRIHYNETDDALWESGNDEGKNAWRATIAIALTAAESFRPADTSVGAGVEPQNWMLINRKEAADLMKKAAEEHADMALNGEPDRASNRESAEAAFTRAQYILAFMPAAYGTTVENAVSSFPQPTIPASLADGLAEALEEIICLARDTTVMEVSVAYAALRVYRTARDGGEV